MADKINEPSQFKSRITDWPLDERPREKLIQQGPAAVSNAELLAILLGQGTDQYNAVELSKQLLRHFKSLEALSQANFKEMQSIRGIGPAKAVKLIAAFQLYRNLKKQRAETDMVRFTNPQRIASIYQPVLGHLEKESFYVILLDAAMRRILDFEITRGLMDVSLVHPREVFNPAIRHMAKGIIVMHNHPSGLLYPSDADLSITKRLVNSGHILEIPVFDHLIITTDDYFSFKEHGLIPEEKKEE